MLAGILRQIAVIALLSMQLLACISPEEVAVSHRGYNERLRPDRQPLSNDQATVDLDTLRHGPYRTGGDQLAPTLVPMLAGPVQHLPQSDCWWLAQAPLGAGDAMRAHWESIVELAPDSGFEDPEDERAELGLCRLNDPESRRPLLAVDRDTNTHEEVEVSGIGDAERVLIGSVAAGRNFPLIVNDQFVLMERLEARRSTLTDPLNSCTARLGTFRTLRVTIARGDDFFDAPTDAGKVPSCTRADGELLLPPEHTQYFLGHGDAGAGAELEPVLLVAGRDTTISRPLTADAGARRWRTDLGERAGQVRWSENFSPNLKVTSVRLMRLVNGQVEYLGDAPPLCIVDADIGAACRWICNDTDARPDVTQYDLASGNSCTNAQGSAAIPDVNPTYSLGTWRAAALRQPLEWRFDFAPSTATFVEFTLGTTFAGMSLLAEPPGLDLGYVRPQERRPGRFTLSNLGEETVRIVQARIDPGWRQPTAFTLRLPFAPEALPVGVEMTEVAAETYRITLPREFEERGLVSIFHGPSHWHLRPAKSPRTPILFDTLAISARDGILYRDRADARIKYSAPAAETRAPVRANVWAERSLPFLLRPGERFDLLLTAAPTSAGRRDARVQVTAESARDPALRQTVAVTATYQAMTGAMPWLGPAHRWFDARHHAPPPAPFLLVNNGDLPLSVATVSFKAESGGAISVENDRFRLVSAHQTPFSVGVGASEVLQVEYEPRCGLAGGVEHRASLHVTSASGASRALLVGLSPRCP